MALKRLLLCSQIVVTIGLLLLLFSNFSWSSFAAVVERIPAWFYLASLALLTLGQFVYAFKWHIVLRAMGEKVSLRRVIEQYFIALFFGNFLPTAIGGDLSKVYYLGRKSGYLQIGISVLMDRALSLLWLIALGTLLVWSLDISSPVFLATRGALTVLLGVAVASFLVAMALPVERLTQKLVGKQLAGRRVDEKFQSFVVQARRLGRMPSVMFGIIGVIAVYFSFLAVIYRGFFWLTLEDDVSFLPILAALMGIAVLSNIPITVNGIGLREQLHYVLFAAVGIAKEPSVGISLLIFSQLLLLSLVGFGLWLRLRMASQFSPAERVGTALLERQ
jgi:uncharacterized protein (TIRG00374 family)